MEPSPRAQLWPSLGRTWWAIPKWRVKYPLPTTLEDTSVTFKDISAPLFFVSSTQINVPFEVVTGTGMASVRVTRGSETGGGAVPDRGDITGDFYTEPTGNRSGGGSSRRQFPAGQ